MDSLTIDVIIYVVPRSVLYICTYSYVYYTTIRMYVANILSLFTYS